MTLLAEGHAILSAAIGLASMFAVVRASGIKFAQKVQFRSDVILAEGILDVAPEAYSGSSLILAVARVIFLYVSVVFFCAAEAAIAPYGSSVAVLGGPRWIQSVKMLMGPGWRALLLTSPQRDRSSFSPKGKCGEHPRVLACSD